MANQGEFECAWCEAEMPLPARFIVGSLPLCGARCDIKMQLKMDGQLPVDEIEFTVDAMSDEEVAIWEELA